MQTRAKPGPKTPFSKKGLDRNATQADALRTTQPVRQKAKTETSRGLTATPKVALKSGLILKKKLDAHNKLDESLNSTRNSKIAPSYTQKRLTLGSSNDRKPTLQDKHEDKGSAEQKSTPGGVRVKKSPKSSSYTEPVAGEQLNGVEADFYKDNEMGLLKRTDGKAQDVYNTEIYRRKPSNRYGDNASERRESNTSSHYRSAKNNTQPMGPPPNLEVPAQSAQRKPSNRYGNSSNDKRCSRTHNDAERQMNCAPNQEAPFSSLPIKDHPSTKEDLLMKSLSKTIFNDWAEGNRAMGYGGREQTPELVALNDTQNELDNKGSEASLDKSGSKDLRPGVKNTLCADQGASRDNYSESEPYRIRKASKSPQKMNVTSRAAENRLAKYSVDKKRDAPLVTKSNAKLSRSVNKTNQSRWFDSSGLKHPLLARNRSKSRSLLIKPSKPVPHAVKDRLRIKTLSKEEYKNFVYQKIAKDDNFSVIDILINRIKSRKLSMPKLHYYLSDLYKQILLTNLIIKHSRKENPIARIEKISLVPCVRPKAKLMTMLIDLDETLIHAEPVKTDALYDHNFDLTRGVIGVRLRPFMFDFLEQVHRKFELVLYTASGDVYASKIREIIDPEGKYFTAVLDRRNCVPFKSAHIKSINALANRSRKEVFVVENSLYAFPFDHDHKILIKPFTDDQEDCELLKLLVFIKEKLIKKKGALTAAITQVVSCQDLLECMHINDLVELFKKYMGGS